MTKAIRKQVKLPVSVAFDVVLQGIRIRLGRSVVTLMGVVFGIAFLMAILTGQMIRQGVSHENEIRAEMKRMMSFLTAEVGPIQGRVVGVIQAGPLSEIEGRFLAELCEHGGNRLRWAGTVPVEAPAVGVESVALAEVAKGAVTVLVVGNGTAPKVMWEEVLALAEQKVVAVTRTTQAVDAGAGSVMVVLERELQPDETAEQAAAARRLKFRTVWIIVISLLVTVIGIANAMLMSVTERFREIGTMKCLGALSAFIRQVFFIEASLLGFTGSLIGCVGGALFAAGVFSLSYGPELVLSSLSLPVLLLQGLFCVVAGVALAIVAAIYPASVASRMVPAVALRSTV
jgi:putative ABC transport system permease protein